MCDSVGDYFPQQFMEWIGKYLIEVYGFDFEWCLSLHYAEGIS